MVFSQFFKENHWLFSSLWESQTFDHFSGADQRPSRGRSAYAPFLPR